LFYNSLQEEFQANATIAELGCGNIGKIVLRNPTHCARVIDCQGHQVILQAMKIHIKDISSIPPLVTTATLTSSLPDSAFTRLRACFTIPCKKNFHNIFVFVWGDTRTWKVSFNGPLPTLVLILLDFLTRPFYAVYKNTMSYGTEILFKILF
jgi:hypothetical protein